MKFDPVDAAVTISSSTGMFKKLHLYPPITTELNATMKSEDTGHGFSEPIAERCAVHRRLPTVLTLLNSVLRYAPVDPTKGHAFVRDQGVSLFAGTEAVPKLTAVHTAGSAALAALPTQLGSYVGKTGSIPAIIGQTRLMLEQIRQRIQHDLGSDFVVTVKAGFEFGAVMGSDPRLSETALASGFDDRELWVKDDLIQRPGHYVISGFKVVDWFGVAGTYSSTVRSTYAYVRKVAWFAVIDGPLLLPVISCSHSVAYSSNATGGRDAWGLPYGVVNATDPAQFITRVTDWGGPAAAPYKMGTVTWTDMSMESLGGLSVPGFLLGAPTPVDSFLLNRVSRIGEDNGAVTLICDDVDLRFTVSGKIVAGMVSAVDANKIAIEATNYGVWLTNSPVKLPTSLYDLIPHWDQAPDADKKGIKDRVVMEEEGVSVTVDDIARRAAGKELKSFALVLGQEAYPTEVETCVITTSGPVFSTTADDWFAAYTRGSQYYSFSVEDGLPPQTAYDFVLAERGTAVTSGSSPIVLRTGPEATIFNAGGPRPGSVPGTDLFQALLSMYATSRDDVTEALKGMWANGMLVRERYQG